MEMREEGRNWGEPWGIQEGPWGETGRARRGVMQKDLWKREGRGQHRQLDPERRGLGPQLQGPE